MMNVGLAAKIMQILSEGGFSEKKKKKRRCLRRYETARIVI